MVGGKNFSQSPFNRATVAMRQPGSAFKPFVYGCAIENGFPQNMLILDAPVAYEGATGQQQWQPQNFSRGYEGEITLRRALAMSQNIPAVRLTEKLGPQAVITFYPPSGNIITAFNRSFAGSGYIGAHIDRTGQCLCHLSQRGQQVAPTAVTEITDRHGRIIWRPHVTTTLSCRGHRPRSSPIC